MYSFCRVTLYFFFSLVASDFHGFGFSKLAAAVDRHERNTKI